MTHRLSTENGCDNGKTGETRRRKATRLPPVNLRATPVEPPNTQLVEFSMFPKNRRTQVARRATAHLCVRSFTLIACVAIGAWALVTINDRNGRRAETVAHELVGKTTIADIKVRTTNTDATRADFKGNFEVSAGIGTDRPMPRHSSGEVAASRPHVAAPPTKTTSPRPAKSSQRRSCRGVR